MINCLQSSISVTRTSLNAFDVAAVAGSFNSWKKVPSGMGRLFAAAFANSSAFEFSALGIYLSVKP